MKDVCYICKQTIEPTDRTALHVDYGPIHDACVGKKPIPSRKILGGVVTDGS